MVSTFAARLESPIRLDVFRLAQAQAPDAEIADLQPLEPRPPHEQPVHRDEAERKRADRERPQRDGTERYGGGVVSSSGCKRVQHDVSSGRFVLLQHASSLLSSPATRGRWREAPE